jgi:hypothetical protein
MMLKLAKAVEKVVPTLLVIPPLKAFQQALTRRQQLFPRWAHTLTHFTGTAGPAPVLSFNCGVEKKDPASENRSRDL